MTSETGGEAYWGWDDDTIHVVASMRHYVHQISSNDDNTEFVSSVGDCVPPPLK